LSNEKNSVLSDSLERCQVKEIGFSTPINNNSSNILDLEISNICLNDLSTILINNVTESSDPPSGFTNELELLEPNWPDIYSEEKSQDVNCNDKNCNSRIVIQNNLNKINENSMSQNDNNENNVSSNNNENDPSYDKNNENDPSYDNNDENDPSYDNNDKNCSSAISKSSEECSVKEKSSLLDDGCPLDIHKLIVPVTTSEKGKIKKHFCLFCKTLQTKFARHLQLKHKNEEEVKKFIYLPKRNKERIKIIDILRKRGNFLHNTRPELNSGILIASRQRQKK